MRGPWTGLSQKRRTRPPPPASPGASLEETAEAEAYMAMAEGRALAASLERNGGYEKKSFAGARAAFD